MYLSEEAGLTTLLAMTQSFEDCEWLVVQEGNKSALLRVGFIISLHFEITGVIFPVLPYSLSLSHTYIHITYVYIFFFFFTMLSYLTYFIGNEQRHNKVLKVLSGTDPNHRCSIVAHFAKYVNVVNVVITSISDAMAFLRGVGDVSMSLIRSVTNMILARSNV